MAAEREGLPYRLDPPPDGINNTDCSLYCLSTYQDSGVPFPAGIRTAEQIRQVCHPIGWNAVEPGDLLFFTGTYAVSEPPGPDGVAASHIGISLGAGTQRMWNAVEPSVRISDISSSYWQSHLHEARRAPMLASLASSGEGPADELSEEPNHQFSFEELYPSIQASCVRYGFDSQVMAGVMQQESGWRNWQVHHDGTGHGLMGLDDNGMLPPFEEWSGIAVGRDGWARTIPVGPQLDYGAYQLAAYANQFGGDPWAACRAWHRGTGAMNDARGQHYEQLIRQHVEMLFG